MASLIWKETIVSIAVLFQKSGYIWDMLRQFVEMFQEHLKHKPGAQENG